MPTKRRRHAVTETPQVERALRALRQETGADRVEMSELVILGAEEKVKRLRVEREDTKALRRRLAERIRFGHLPVDPDAAAEVRRTGWVRS